MGHQIWGQEDTSHVWVSRAGRGCSLRTASDTPSLIGCLSLVG